MNKLFRVEVVLTVIGTLLILFSLLMALWNMWEDRRAKLKSASIVEQFNIMLMNENHDSDGAIHEASANLYKAYPNADMPVKKIGPDTFVGLLSIPVLELSLPVYSEWSYDHLKDAPCRYSGSVGTNNLVIAAHNYQSHFGSVYSLQVGDIVFFIDANGTIFKYEVVEIETLEASDVDKMVNSSYDLSLFTCTIGGRNRVTVRCKFVPM